MNNSLYTDLEVWKKGRELTNTIYEITKTFPSNENFGLTSQMRRSAVFFPSNIAEEQLDNTLLLITYCKKLIQGFINYQKTK